MMHKGWNVNSMGKHGMSYLLYAIWEHNYDMTKFLLEHGADINQFDSVKETVITNQAVTAQWAFVLWLWDKGADPMKTGGVGVFEGEVNVAFWVQDFIDSGIGDYDNPDFKKLVARLKSIGVEFPYKPAMINRKDNE